MLNPIKRINKAEQDNLDHEIIAQAEELQITMDTTGWNKVVQPLLDKMINDIIGGKQPDGSYDIGIPGLTQQPAEEALKAFQYRQALMEFNNHLRSYFVIAAKARKRLDTPEEVESVEKYTMPLQDTRYALKPQPSEMVVPKEGEQDG